MTATDATLVVELLARLDRLQARVAELESERDAARRRQWEAEQREAAVAAVLRAISRTPADLPAVLESICESAIRLCDDSDALIHRLEGNDLVLAALTGPHWGRLRRGGRTPIQTASYPVDLVRDRRRCGCSICRLSVRPGDYDRRPGY